MSKSSLGEAYVQIVPSADGIGDGISKTISPAATKAGTSAGKTIAGKIGSTMQRVGAGMMKTGALATAISVPLVAGIKKVVGAYNIQQEAETKLTEIYKTRMGVGKKAVAQTVKLASAQQKLGVIGDEVQLSGAQQLATFAKYPSTVNALLPAMNNLLAQQKGVNATQGDAVNIANLMGKVLGGQVGALTRVGISFDEEQEKILKFGTEEEKAATLAQVITDNVGNMNEALAATPAGKMQQLKNTMGDLAEQVGATLAPVLANVADFISVKIVPALEKAVAFLQANPIIANIVVGITGLLAVGGPLLIMIGAVVSAVGALIPIITAISAPVALIAAGIAAVVAAMVALYTQSESFRSAVNQIASIMASAMKPILDAIVKEFGSLFREIGKLITEIGTGLAPIFKALVPVFKVVAKIIATVLLNPIRQIIATIRIVIAVVRTVGQIFGTIFGGVVKTIQGAYTKMKGAIDKIRSVLNFANIASTVKGVFNTVKEAITGPISTAKEKVKGIIDKIKGIFPIDIGNILSNVKLPHFSLNWGSKDFGPLGSISYPKGFSVSWYAKGGIITQPTMFAGMGENGAEAIVPLDPFWKKLERTIDSREGITINVYGAEGQSPKEVAEEVKRMLIRETNQRRLAWNI